MWKFVAVVVFALLVLGACACEKGLGQGVEKRVELVGIYGGVLAPGLPARVTLEGLGLEVANPFYPPEELNGWKVKVCGETARLAKSGPDGLEFWVPTQLRRSMRQSDMCWVEVKRDDRVVWMERANVLREWGWLENGGGGSLVAGLWIKGEVLRGIEKGVIQAEVGEEVTLVLYARGWGYELEGVRVPRGRARLMIRSGPELVTILEEMGLYHTGVYGGRVVVVKWTVSRKGELALRLDVGGKVGNTRYMEVR